MTTLVGLKYAQGLLAPLVREVNRRIQELVYQPELKGDQEIVDQTQKLVRQLSQLFFDTITVAVDDMPMCDAMGFLRSSIEF